MSSLLDIINATDDVDIVGYINKNKWKNSTEQYCLHCGDKIEYRPFPMGVGKDTSSSNNVIMTDNYEFCCPMCAKGYMYEKNLYKNSSLVGSTDTIYRDFRDILDEYDDPIYKKILQNYESFIDIPAAPSRKQFKKYGGQYDRNNIVEYYNKVIQKESNTNMAILIKNRLGL